MYGVKYTYTPKITYLSINEKKSPFKLKLLGLCKQFKCSDNFE